jgi:NADH:quinone reductase (non-electrogenic)
LVNYKSYSKKWRRRNDETRVTEIFGIEYPIVQGGLAYLAYAEQAAAISNAGGLGQITAAKLGTPENGGIGDGRGFLAAFSLGAEGIEMGTRFIATKECFHANEKYKQAILHAKETDTVVIKRTLGSPGRVLKSGYTLDILEREQEGAIYEDLKEVISGKANCRYIYDGEELEGFGWAGQVVGLIQTIPTVQELFDEMILTAEKGLSRIDNIFGERSHK